MLPAEWTRMAIAFAVAIVAMSYLAIDAGVVNPSVIARPIKVAQASIIGAAMVGALRSGGKGVQRYTYSGLKALARLKPARAVPVRTDSGRIER